MKQLSSIPIPTIFLLSPNARNQEEKISILSSEQVSLSLMKFINHFYKLIDIMINKIKEEFIG